MNSVRRQCCDKDEAGWFVTHGTGASLREYVYWGSQQIALAVKGTSSTPATSLLDESGESFQGSHIIATNNANYAGTGFIDYVGEGQADWLFYAPSSTTYNIKLRYSLGNTANRPLALLVDGVQKSLINFTPTATWAIWNTLELSVTIPQGNHTISLKTTGKSGPNVDQMELNYTVAGTASSLYFVHNDHLNTPQVVTNSAQQVVWMGDYQPFGKLAQNQNNSIELYSRFPGQYWDGETGLYYNYFRDYDPSIGRYIESDPIGLGGGINTYAYVEGNPLRGVDPYGLANNDHTTGQWKECSKGCRIRIDYTVQDGIKKRHLHWECKNGAGVGGEFGGASHGETLSGAPKHIKECAKDNGFEPDPIQECTSNSTANAWKALGIGAAVAAGVACVIAEPCGAIAVATGTGILMTQ